MAGQNAFARLAWMPAGLAGLLALAWLVGLRLNLTGSLPIGVYVVSRTPPTPLRRGTLVLLCLPASVARFAKARGYVPPGGSCPGGVVPVGKRIAAIAGDTVRMTGTGLWVNGRLVPNSGPFEADRNGRPLPSLARGRSVVGPGEVWVVSSYSRWSFDSRYFGPVAAAGVRARLRPLVASGLARGAASERRSAASACPCLWPRGQR